jgi:CRP-like cAMP-binding protein
MTGEQGRLKARFKTTSRASGRSPLVEFREGQFIFKAGDLGADMFVIHEGKVEVTDFGAGGERTVAILEKGDFFGEMAILEGVPRSASVRALTDLKLVRIDGTTFTQLLRSQPEVGIRIMRKLSGRLRRAEGLESPRASGADEEAASSAEAGTRPILLHAESGKRFQLPATEVVLVGRRDPITGVQPEVDLTGVDPKRSCSRQHGKILRDGERYLVVEDIGTTNGTFLNGKKLATGVPEEVTADDELRFGLVTLTFQLE